MAFLWNSGWFCGLISLRWNKKNLLYLIRRFDNCLLSSSGNTKIIAPKKISDLFYETFFYILDEILINSDTLRHKWLKTQFIGELWIILIIFEINSYFYYKISYSKSKSIKNLSKTSIKSHFRKKKLWPEIFIVDP